MSELSRFMQLVEKEPLSGCWLWLGYTNAAGYGIHSRLKKRTYAHRRAWELMRGSISGETMVCHRCDTPACVNPEHLFLGSHSDNMADMRAKGRAFRPAGTLHPQHRLSEQAVRYVRQQYGRNGVSYSMLGRALNVSWEAIRNIVKGRSWKTVK